MNNKILFNNILLIISVTYEYAIYSCNCAGNPTGPFFYLTFQYPCLAVYPKSYKQEPSITSLYSIQCT